MAIGVAIDLVLIIVVQLAAARLVGRSFFGEPSVFADTLGRRVGVVASGFGVAYLAAAVVLFSSVLVAGESVPTLEVDPLPGSPAELGGIEAGDRITRIDRRPVERWEDLRSFVQAGGDPVEVEVVRSGVTSTFSIQRRDGAIGVRPRMEERELPLPLAASRALATPVVIVWQVARGLLGTQMTEVSGPVGVIAVGGSSLLVPLIYVFGAWMSLGLIPAALMDCVIVGALWRRSQRAG